MIKLSTNLRTNLFFCYLHCIFAIRVNLDSDGLGSGRQFVWFLIIFLTPISKIGVLSYKAFFSEYPNLLGFLSFFLCFLQLAFFLTVYLFFYVLLALFGFFTKKFEAFFTGTFQVSRKELTTFFTYAIYFFHARDFKEIFTETCCISRALFKIFSRALQIFTGRNLKIFTEGILVFTGKKKHWSQMGSIFGS